MNFLSLSVIILMQHGLPFCSIISCILVNCSVFGIYASTTSTFGQPMVSVMKSLTVVPLSSWFLALYSLHLLAIPASLKCVPSTYSAGISLDLCIKNASSASKAMQYYGRIFSLSTFYVCGSSSPAPSGSSSPVFSGFSIGISFMKTSSASSFDLGNPSRMKPLFMQAADPSWNLTKSAKISSVNLGV